MRPGTNFAERNLFLVQVCGDNAAYPVLFSRHFEVIKIYFVQGFAVSFKYPLIHFHLTFLFDVYCEPF